jgi:hypothetical protein
MGIHFPAAVAALVGAALSVLGAGVALAEGDAAAPSAAAPAVSRPAAHAGARVPRPERAPAGMSATNALLPGFETLADGSTRLFVELSRPVSYETKAARGSLTYVLKGARPGRRNNMNPLVTLHFNTPVASARLVPRGHDLWFVVALRADVQPTVTMDPAKDGGAVLRIDFPKGDYVPAASAAPPRAAAPARPADTPPESSDDTPPTSP